MPHSKLKIKDIKYPEHTEGSRFARVSREDSNGLNEEEHDKLHQRAMASIFGNVVPEPAENRD
jgi:hypothetical protein